MFTELAQEMQKAVLGSQFSVLSSQFSVLSSQFSVLSSQFSVAKTKAGRIGSGPPFLDFIL